MRVDKRLAGMNGLKKAGTCRHEEKSQGQHCRERWMGWHAGLMASRGTK